MSKIDQRFSLALALRETYSVIDQLICIRAVTKHSDLNNTIIRPYKCIDLEDTHTRTIVRDEMVKPCSPLH